MEAEQLKELFGFRLHRRIEEHLLTANVMVDKSRANSMPLWILGLDLSRAFDRIDWHALWQALRAHGVSGKIVWILQCFHFGQLCEIVTANDRSEPFAIRAGVRQGCVLSPRLFCAVLEWAMRDLKALELDLGFFFKHAFFRLQECPLVSPRLGSSRCG